LTPEEKKTLDDKTADLKKTEDDINQKQKELKDADEKAKELKKKSDDADAAGVKKLDEAS
jgi:hypothetical protein